MNWIAMCLMLISRIPFEKFLSKPSGSSKALQELESQMAAQPITSLPILPTPEVKRAGSGVTTTETIQYQREEMVKELSLLEKHLQQGCKIFGKACDCCEKHPVTVEGLAQETLGMTADPLYSEVAQWARKLAPITTIEASESRQYDKVYYQLAVEARELRKRISTDMDKSIQGSVEWSQEQIKNLTAEDTAELVSGLKQIAKQSADSVPRGFRKAHG